MDALSALRCALRANIAAVVWGDPGVGKTARVRQVTQNELHWPLYEVIASIREPSDFAGYPVPVNGHVRLVPSGEWNDFAKKAEEAGGGVLFLDEISCFVGETPVAVLTSVGVEFVPISQVCCGQRVLGMDLHSGRSCANTVTRVHTKEDRYGARITFSDGTSVVCTTNHEFYTECGWLAAGRLSVGTRVRDLSGVLRAPRDDNEHSLAHARHDDRHVQADVPGAPARGTSTRHAPDGEGTGDDADTTRNGSRIRSDLAGVRTSASAPTGIHERSGECRDTAAFCGVVCAAAHTNTAAGDRQARWANDSTRAPGRARALDSSRSRSGMLPEGAQGDVGQSQAPVAGPCAPGTHLREEQVRRTGRPHSTAPDAEQTDTCREAHDRADRGVRAPTGVHGGQSSQDADPERNACLAEPGLHEHGQDPRCASGLVRAPASSGAGADGLCLDRSTCASRASARAGQPEGAGAPDQAVSWREVVRVELITLDEPVYDLTTEPHHNYVVGNGLLAHNCTPPAVQAALMRVVLDRHVGELQLPSSVRVVCAANPTGLAAGGWDLAAPLANRLIHISWPSPPVDDWLAWLISESTKPGDPQRWLGAEGLRVRSLLAGFMQRFPGRLIEVPKDEESRGRAWPSPRSWEMCARSLSEVIDPHPAELPLDSLSFLASSAVGSGAGAELVAWAKDADLPDPEAVLEDPTSWQVDASRQDRVWATLAGVYASVMAKRDAKGAIPAKRWKAAWAVFGQADKHGATGAATAALAIPLAKSAAPGGPGFGLPISDEVYEAQALRREALGLPPVERPVKAA